MRAPQDSEENRGSRRAHLFCSLWSWNPLLCSKSKPVPEYCGLRPCGSDLPRVETIIEVQKGWHEVHVAYYGQTPLFLLPLSFICSSNSCPFSFLPPEPHWRPLAVRRTRICQSDRHTERHESCSTLLVLLLVIYIEVISTSKSSLAPQGL